jgi:AraC family transcriptional regulator of adaptative response / DNA-3-methyladenine glycosylase II
MHRRNLDATSPAIVVSGTGGGCSDGRWSDDGGLGDGDRDAVSRAQPRTDVDREGARLRVRRPFAAEPLFRFLGDRAIPGVETFDGRTFRRAIHVRDGSDAIVSLTPSPTAAHVTVETNARDRDEVIKRSRRLLDLDADPAAIEAILGRDLDLRPLVRAHPGVRVPGAVDGFELAVRAVVGQQISVKGARTIAGRIVAAAGTPLAPGRAVDGISHLFPTAEELAAAPLEELGMTGARVATLRRLAQLVAAGELDLSGRTSTKTALERLLAIRGVGPWTVSYIAMRALRDADAFPVEDLGIRLGMAALGLPTTRAAIRDRAERWRPWRAYAAMHLWNAPAPPAREAGRR